MRFSIIAVAVGILACSDAAPTSARRYAVHEKRETLPKEWKRSALVHPDSTIPLRIALTQRNLDKGEEYLMDVSDPKSENYGKHWSINQIAETFAPSSETVDEVSKWLSEAGISFKQSKGLNWLDAKVTIEQAEALLKTKYFEYTHETGSKHIACEGYSVPEDIRQHIDFVIPTVHFDIKVKQPIHKGLEERQATVDNTLIAHDIGKPGAGIVNPVAGSNVSPFDIINELEQCDTHITPNCLRALYKFPPNFPAAKGNSYGIVEYTPQAYLQNDLNLFFANYSPPLVGKSPIFDSIDGGILQTTDQSFGYNGESDLDLEYAMALVYPLQVTLYQVGDVVEGASFNDFLDGIDASYCTYMGGDDPTQDGTYPDPYGTAAEGAYEGKKDCGKYGPTKVISTSYGYNEHDLTPFYENRQCNEYMKLGLAGTTILYSSGDYGVAGNQGQCIDPATGEYNSGTSGKFNPSFPGTCPYVLSIGATQVKVNETNVVTTTQPEMACESVIYSGGGFSNVFAMPSYQKTAVASYFKNYNPPYGADRYNNSMKTRGFPDVSANGANYVVAYDGKFGRVFGTSASSPTFGSILTLVNSARMNIGKGPIGFANPVFYQHPEILTDIVEGGNQGCGTPGFTAVPGWDPVTGLGTPNFPKMLALWLLLP